jgi:hypothetical protein
LGLRSAVHTTSGDGQRFVRRDLAVAVFDVATAIIYVVFFVDRRSFRSGRNLYGRPFALGCFTAASFRLDCTFHQFSLPDIRKNTSIKMKSAKKLRLRHGGGPTLIAAVETHHRDAASLSFDFPKLCSEREHGPQRLGREEVQK